MEEQNRRLRLIVEVLPLPAEETHEAHRAAALAAFKGRKFALPVFSEQTIGDVWRLIEERYKKNYLHYAEAALFHIKKLQDAYECDLDMGDTVGAVFEGEHDNQMRMIKVVPTYNNRMASLPPTSNLRPASVPKRTREHSRDQVNKRRRVEAPQSELVEPDSTRNHPHASVESDMGLFYSDVEEGSNEREPAGGFGTGRLERSGTPESVEVVEQSRTGLHEFDMDSKEESPELGLPAVQTITPRPSGSGKKMRKTRSDKGRKRGPRNLASPARIRGAPTDPTTSASLGNPGRSSRVEPPSVVVPRWTKLPDVTAVDVTLATPKRPGRLPRVSKIGYAAFSTAKHPTVTKDIEGVHGRTTPGPILRPERRPKAAHLLPRDIQHPTVKRRGRPKKLTAPFVTSSDDEADELSSPKPAGPYENSTHDRGSRRSPPAEVNHASAEPAAENNSVNSDLVAGNEMPAENGSAGTNDAAVVVELAGPSNVLVREEPIENDNASLEADLTEERDASMRVEPAKNDDAVVGAERTEDENASLRTDQVKNHDGDIRAMSIKGKGASAEAKPVEDGNSAVRAEPAGDEDAAGVSKLAEEEVPSNGAYHTEVNNVSRDAEPVETNNNPIGTVFVEAEHGVVQPERRVSRSRTAAASRSTAKGKASHEKMMKSIFPDGRRPSLEWDSAPFYPASKTNSRNAHQRNRVEKEVEQPQKGGLKGKLELQTQLQPIATSTSTRKKFGFLDEDPIEDSQRPAVKKSAAATPEPGSLRSESQAFQTVGQQNGTSIQIKTGLASASTSQPISVHQENKETCELETEQEPVGTDSKSNSAPNSTRSSPEATRPPARYLSHSPTPDKSSSNEESETSQSPYSRAGSPKIVDPESESDSDDSSDEAEDENDKESEYEDTKEPPVGHKPPELPSSPPQIPPPSNTLVPATQSSQLQSLTQRPVQMTPSLPPSSTPLASASQPTPLRRTCARPATGRPMYSKFGTLSEQIKRMNAQKNSTIQTVKFDAKTRNLGRLKTGAVNGFGRSDSSDDESSSSSEEEDSKGKTRASCSVT